MSTRNLVVIFFLLSGSIAQASQEAHVRGVLVWTAEKQVVTECKSGRVYWVRVLVSNPHFLLTEKVDELTSKGHGNIIAEFRGEMKMGIPSVGPKYPVDGTLNVYQIISVAQGSCDR